MKIRMLTSMAGPAISLAPGDVAEFPAAEAARIIAAGFAEPLRDESPIETAVPAPAPEKAVRKPRQRKADE